MVVDIKLFRMHTPEQTNDPLLDETRDDFPGWGSQDLIRLRPLMTFKDVAEALSKMDFRWHERVYHTVEHTDIRLRDQNTLEISAHFKNDQNYNEFNRLCWKNPQIPHGWHRYKPGIFYQSK